MKGASVFKKVLKTFIWIVSIGVIIFILIAVIIQIPSVQTRIVHFATSFVSKKTHTKVEIKNVEFYDKFGNLSSRFNSFDPMTIRICYYAYEKIFDPVFGIALRPVEK